MGLSSWVGTGPYAGRTIRLCARDFFNPRVWYCDLGGTVDNVAVWFNGLQDNEPYSYIPRVTAKSAFGRNFPYGLAVLPD